MRQLFVSYSFYIVSKPTVFSLKHTQWLLNQETRFIIHLFFIDDLKTYAQNIREAKQQLDLITTFSKDIKMEFGIEKCSYINIEGGKKKSLGENLCLNDF